MDARIGALRLDAKGVTPLYLQLANLLASAIAGGDWAPDEALPSERALCAALSISRVTARKAIDVLCGRGLLTRRQGSGTYITPKLEQPLSRLSGFSEELSLRGFAAGSRWLERELGTVLPAEQAPLALPPNALVARLRRLRTANEVVMAIETTTIPAAHLPEPGRMGDSLYGYLEARGSVPVRALQHIRAVNASDEQARLMGLAPGAAMLHVTRVSYLESGMPVELTHSYCRNDYYEFVAESRR